jgi:hypothetical protein
MKHHYGPKTTWFVFGLIAVTLAASLPPGVAAATYGEHPAAPASAHSHVAMPQVPRLQPKRIVTVTGNEDWDSQRGFGKDSAMAEMMTLMMVGGSGMEHMKMGPRKKGGARMAGMNTDDVPMSSSETTGQSLGLSLSATITPNPPVVGHNALDITATDASGKPMTGLKLAASVAMTTMDMGTEHPKVVAGPDGHYTTVVNFSMKGPWQVVLTGSASGSKTRAVRNAMDFNVGSNQKWGQTAGPTVTLNTPPDSLKVGKNTLQFTITDAAGKPITGAKVTMAVAMTSMNMGTARPAAREGKDGRYLTEVEFSMEGPWRVTLAITPPNGKPLTRSFYFNIRAEGGVRCRRLSHGAEPSLAPGETHLVQPGCPHA